MFLVQSAGTFPWPSALQKYLWFADAEVLLKPPNMSWSLQFWEKEAEPHTARYAAIRRKLGHSVPLRDTFHGCTSTGLYSLTISLPHGRKPNQVPYNASPYVCDRRAYLPSQPVLHSAWFGRPLENYFTGSWQDSASLCLRHWPALPPLVRPPSCTEGWRIWPAAAAVDSWHTVSSEGFSSDRLWSGCTWEPSPWALQAALTTCPISVSWNICWITDTGEFHVLSHRKFSGLQSWLQIAPGNNSEYIFSSNISMGKDELLHMIWGNFFFLQRTLLPN